MTGTASSRDAGLERLRAMPHPLRWALAARLKTLGLSQVPVLAGSWLAAGQGMFRADAMVLAMLASAAIQIGTNLWNDAADAASGVDGPERLGPPRLTSLGLLNAGAVRRAAAGAFAVAALAGAYLAVLGGWPILLIGVVSLALGYGYSMGPRPMSGLPFGEALVIAFFGLVAVAGTMLLHGATPDAAALHLGLVTGLPAAAVLLLNNHRDREGDARGGRRTLAIVIGPNGSRALYSGFLFAALGLAALSAPCVTLLPAAGLALWLGHAMTHWPVSERLNRLLGQTALFQVLLLAGLVAAPLTCG
jgi:1,4-dihydroxy-2-naphthoate octaprenyltransferase